MSHDMSERIGRPPRATPGCGRPPSAARNRERPAISAFLERVRRVFRFAPHLRRSTSTALNSDAMPSPAGPRRPFVQRRSAPSPQRVGHRFRGRASPVRGSMAMTRIILLLAAFEELIEFLLRRLLPGFVWMTSGTFRPNVLVKYDSESWNVINCFSACPSASPTRRPSASFQLLDVLRRPVVVPAAWAGSRCFRSSRIASTIRTA